MSASAIWQATTGSSLILVDYPNRRRLKLLGRAQADLGRTRIRRLLERLELPGYRAKVERGLVIAVEAFDWNCPQHITPRFTEAEIDGGGGAAACAHRRAGGRAGRPLTAPRAGPILPPQQRRAGAVADEGEDWRAVNRANWDERVPIHLAAPSYDLSPLRAGRGG